MSSPLAAPVQEHVLENLSALVDGKPDRQSEELPECDVALWNDHVSRRDDLEMGENHDAASKAMSSSDDLDTSTVASGSCDLQAGQKASFPQSALVQVSDPKVPASTPRLEALDGPRWIASVQIILYHFYGHTWGSSWTQFFFILSGFILAYVEMARPEKARCSEMSQLAYVRKRLGTLYPTYIFAIVLVQFQIPGNAWDLATLPLHLLLMQAWFPITYYKDGTPRWSGTQWAEVAWFVSVLVIYWLLLRPITRRVRHLAIRTCCWLLGALWAWSLVILLAGDVYVTRYLGCVYPKMCSMSIANALIYQGVLGNVHIFVAGIVAARIFILTSTSDAATGAVPGVSTQRLVLDKARAPFLFRYGVIIGYALFALVACFGGKPLYDAYKYFWHNGGIMPAMLLVLLGGSIGEDPVAKYVFQHPIFLTLGRISYAQYILQFRVWFMMGGYFPNETVRKITFPFVLLACAYLTERFIGRVFNEWQRFRAEKGMKGVDDKALEFAEGLLARCPRRRGNHKAASHAEQV